MGSAECGVRSVVCVECKVWTEECKVQSAKCGV